MAPCLAPTQVTSYTYIGKPAWHFDDNELVKPENRTYGQFRGYTQIETRTGDTTHTADTADTQTLTRTTYFRGMDGDTLPNNGRRSATVTDSLGEAVPDNNLYADHPREVQTFNGDGGPQLSTTITDPVTIATTATRTRTGLPALTADMVATAKTRALTNLAAGGVRTASTTNRYDSTGRLVASTSSGDGVPDMCSTTTYADNPTVWIRDAVQEVVISQQACPDAGDPTPVLIVSDARTFYDGSDTLGQITRGDATRTDAATNNDKGHLTVATSGRTTYDTGGRPLSVTDAAGHVSTTAYTPSNGGILTQSVVTNSKNQKVSAQYEPTRGSTTVGIDIAGHRTDAVYDPLGRLTAIWKPGQSKAGDKPATATYDYLLRSDGPLAVTSHVLVDYAPGKTNYVNTVALYDGLGQQRQTQTDAEGGGRIVADTFYDSHGWTRISNNRYYTDGAPSTTIVQVADSAVDDRTIVNYDGSGRATVTTAYRGLQATWSARTVYGGDRTTVLPPQGGIPTTTVVDVRGKTIELDQYTTPPVVNGDIVTGGAPQATKYHYTPTGLQDSVTDVNNITWTFQYDFLGRKVSHTDPDTGTSTTAYDLLGQVTSTTDARGQTLSYDYDELGRKTAEHNGSATGPKMAEWTWDTLQAGRLTSSVRHTPDGDYTSLVTGYDGRGRPWATRLLIPDSEKSLAGDYTTEYAFTTTDQPIAFHPHPGGGLPDEILRTTYDKLGKPQTLQGDFSYVSKSTYTPYGEAAQYTLSSLDSSASLTYGYDPQTRRLTSQNLSAETADANVSHNQYFYDPAGNPTKTVETRGSVTPQTRTQCYQYDALDRLAQSWTATDNCTAAPSASNVGGPNPYWTSWTFEPGGLRTQQTKHALPGIAGGDTVTQYSYPASANQPHTLSGTTTTGPGAGTTNYTYDPAGNTLTRAIPAGNQTLTWNQENRLDTVTTPAGQTSYVYDADGNELIRHDPTQTTLFLPSEELVRDNNTGAVTGTRYYSHNGTTIALRVGSTGNPKYMLSDPHGTGQVTSDSVSRAITRRDSDPYGNELGQTQGGPWPDQHGFLGKSKDDTTGLTDVGARAYDPMTGRFISADPLLEVASPEQLNGYTYAGNNPITSSDPAGLCSGPDGIGCRAPASKTDDYYNGGPDGVKRYEDSRNVWLKNQRQFEFESAVLTKQKIIADHIKKYSPKTNDPDKLYAIFQMGSDGMYESGWWIPRCDDGVCGNACYFRRGCHEAWMHLNRNPTDVEGAKYIAAMYCVENYDECYRAAGAEDASLALVFTVGTGLYAGSGARGAGSAAEATTMTATRAVETEEAAIRQAQAAEEQTAAACNSFTLDTLNRSGIDRD